MTSSRKKPAQRKTSARAKVARDEEWSTDEKNPGGKVKAAPKARARAATSSRTRSGIPLKRKRNEVKPARTTVDEPVRIQKFLANAGLASRRTIEEWIRAGKVKVNNEIAILGQSVSSEDSIYVDGKQLYLKAIDKDETRVLLYHKPEGELCAAKSEHGKPTVFENLPKVKGSKWVMVGRLDINTSGLLILTNNGALAHHLMHPSFAQVRQYAVRVLGKVTEEIIENLINGVLIEDELFSFKSVKFA